MKEMSEIRNRFRTVVILVAQAIKLAVQAIKLAVNDVREKMRASFNERDLSFRCQSGANFPFCSCG
jgi:hypothetical protein